MEHGVSISPIAFIIVQPSGVKLLPVNHSSSIDKLLDLVPDLIEKTTQMIEQKIKSSEKLIKDNIIVRVNDAENKKDLSNENDEKNKQTSEENQYDLDNKESKPYDIEYDETDI